MKQANDSPFCFPTAAEPTVDDLLSEVIRRGARTLLSQAVEAQVEQWIADHAQTTDQRGHR
jgi:hypothetical protein